MTAGFVQAAAEAIDFGNALVPPAGTDKFMMCCWARPESALGTDGRMISRGTSPNFGGQQEFGMMPDDIDFVSYNFRAEVRTVLNFTNLISATVLATDVWHHFAATMDTAFDTNLRLYIDGVLNLTGGFLTGNLNSVGGIPFWIGDRTDVSGERPYNGRLDDVRIDFGRRYSDLDIKNIAEGYGIDGYLPDHRWLMDEFPDLAAIGANQVVDIGENPIPNGSGVNTPNYHPSTQIALGYSHNR